MTRAVAIDFGTSRTKLAYLNGDRPELMRFSHDRAFAPSLFYLRRGSDTVAWGDEAEDMLADDAGGVVDVLKRRLRQNKIRANSRAEPPERLLTFMFSELREQAARELPSLSGVAPDTIRLTVPALFGPAEEELLRRAARRANFEEVTIIVEPVAAARHWLSETRKSADHVIVFDCGGGTVDWAYLTKSDCELRLVPQCPPGGLEDVGGYDVDLALLEIVRARLGTDTHALSELSERQPYYLARLRARKEDVNRGKLPRPFRVANKAIEISSGEVLAAAEARFTDRACQAFAEYARRVESLARERPPVLLVGGSSQLRGLEKKLQELGYRVEHWDRSEFATVLGAVVAGQAPVQDLTEVDFDLIVEWAEAGRADAQAELGERYSEGVRGATKQPELACHWYRKSAAQNNPAGMIGLSSHYNSGEGIPRDDNEAFRLTSKAAESDYPDALAQLGYYYSEGYGCIRSAKLAERHLRAAAEKESLLAKFLLGAYLKTGGCLLQDRTEACYWLGQVACQENWKYRAIIVLAQALLGMLYLEEGATDRDPDEGLKWLRRAAKAGNADAQYLLGATYIAGRDVGRNIEDGISWLKKAAGQGHIKAHSMIGYTYIQSESGRDKAEGFDWLKQAAEKGDVEAQSSLAACYRNGTGVAHNMAEAVKWYLRAAEQNDTDAQRVLGFLYHQGEGVQQDYRKAIYFTERAASKGDRQAQYNAGFAYAFEGPERNYKNAAYWFSKYIEQDSHSELYDILLLSLRESSYDTADQVTVKLIRFKTNTETFDSAESASSIPRELFYVLDFYWTYLASSRLVNRPWVNISSTLTKFTSVFSMTTWLKWRLKELNLA